MNTKRSKIVCTMPTNRASRSSYTMIQRTTESYQPTTRLEHTGLNGQNRKRRLQRRTKLCRLVSQARHTACGWECVVEEHDTPASQSTLLASGGVTRTRGGVVQPRIPCLGSRKQRKGGSFPFNQSNMISLPRLSRLLSTPNSVPAVPVSVGPFSFHHTLCPKYE